MGIDISELMLPEELSLASDQVRLRFLQQDLAKEQKRKDLKSRWTAEWETMFLKGACAQWDEVLASLRKHRTDKVQGGIVLLELINFTPYIPLKPSSSPSAEEKKAHKELARCRLDDEVKNAVLAA